MQPNDAKYLIEQLLASNTFKNKEVQKGLLQFLFQNSLKEKKLKEIDIACDFFKRDKTFVPGDDTIVRVNIYKLRQLLNTYYTTEGRDDDIQVSIPKGSYFLVFATIKNNGEIDEKGSITKIILVAVLFISLVVNLILGLSINRNNKIEYHPVWKDYNNGVRPISIILGNPYFYSIQDKDRTQLICRNLDINSKSDMEDAQSGIAIDYPYFSSNNVMPLLSVFSSLKWSKEVELKSLSEVNPEHIKSNNQIFIANINSFGFYSTFLKETSIRISTKPRQIILLSDTDTTRFFVSEKNKGYHDDYALFVKIPGPDLNIITLMGDFHASGNVGVSNMFQDAAKMIELSDFVLSKYDHFPRYFEMIVKVSCYEHTDLETSIVYFNEIEYERNNAMYFPETFY